MNRRAFTFSLAGVLGGIGALLRLRRPTSRIYKAELGHRGRVFLNGTEVQRCYACKTGQNGWVRYWEGVALDDGWGGLCRAHAFGDVRFVPMKA